MESRLSGIQICEGSTGHTRHHPRSNAFRYPVLYIRFNTKLAQSVHHQLRLALKVFSFRTQDYLRKETGDLDQAIRELLRQQVGFEANDIELLTIPRLFGYAFNPVSFWFCRKDGVLEAVFCEVNNTFGERHFYWVPTPNPLEWYPVDKSFHVSPFLPVKGFYKFRFQEIQNRTRVDITYHNPTGERILSTWLDVRHRPLEEAKLFSLLLKYGWVTIFVTARIHFQALRLFFKRVSFFRKPELPKSEVTR